LFLRGRFLLPPLGQHAFEQLGGRLVVAAFAAGQLAAERLGQDPLRQLLGPRRGNANRLGVASSFTAKPVAAITPRGHGNTPECGNITGTSTLGECGCTIALGGSWANGVTNTGLVPNVEVAGTYYWEKKKRWFTFDQVIVSGSLLTEAMPFLDEEHLAVVVSPETLGNEPIPRKFQLGADRSSGLSDHLPMYGQIVLERGNDHG
jgi:hypothetical protein